VNLIIGCDDAAYDMKEILKEHLEKKGHVIFDVGVNDKTTSIYPDIADKLCCKIISGRYEKGFLLCGTGIGMAITANKIPGIRAAVGHDLFSVERSIKSNNCQVLCFGARIIAPQYAVMLADRWLECEFDGGNSAYKVQRIMEIEDEYHR
jgi:sugar-phosphate isomerases, RpiB/LacA/LacB family